MGVGASCTICQCECAACAACALKKAPTFPPASKEATVAPSLPHARADCKLDTKAINCQRHEVIVLLVQTIKRTAICHPVMQCCSSTYVGSSGRCCWALRLLCGLQPPALSSGGSRPPLTLLKHNPARIVLSPAGSEAHVSACKRDRLRMALMSCALGCEADQSIAFLKHTGVWAIQDCPSKARRSRSPCALASTGSTLSVSDKIDPITRLQRLRSTGVLPLT